MDTYYIDESAANSDISKIGQAIRDLQRARQSIHTLNTTAEGMRGQTGSAIAEKAQELLARIDRQIRLLSASAELLRQAVIHYQQVDAAHAVRIGRHS